MLPHPDPLPAGRGRVHWQTSYYIYSKPYIIHMNRIQHNRCKKYMNVQLIKTKKDYHDTLCRIEGLWSAKLGTNKGDELDVLTTLVEKYEEDNLKILVN